MSLHRNFGRSKLVRLLGGSTSTAVPTAPQDFAERLGRWLNPFDAVKLHATCQAVQALQGGGALPGATQHLARLDAAVQKAHRSLVVAIMADNWPVPETGNETHPVTLRRHAQDLQRQMEATLAGLRTQVWQGLAVVSPRMRQLVELDAAIASVLAGQAPKGWAAVPALVEKQLGSTSPGDAVRLAHQRIWQQALLAELEVRMQPVWGLMEAGATEVKSEVKKSQ
jgi:Protein of unknown function (DUF3348)